MTKTRPIKFQVLPLLISSATLIITQNLYGVSALGFESFFSSTKDSSTESSGGTYYDDEITEEIEELPDSVDVYAGHETVVGGGSYHADVSYAIMNLQISDNYPHLPHNVDPEHNPVPKRYKGMPLQIMGDKQTFYEDLMTGCREKYRGGACDNTERDRVAMNKRQPPGMQNYTEMGFKKIKAPKEVFDIIK